MTVKELLIFFLPEKCYETFFVNFHPHVACSVFVLNKIFGFWILLDALLEQLPQLAKILWRRSAAGLSLTSALLQLYAYSCPVLYAAANSYPIYSWGERLLALVQSAAIVFLIVHYRGKAVKEAFPIPIYCNKVAPPGGIAETLDDHSENGNLLKISVVSCLGVHFFFFAGFSLAGLWLLLAYATAMFLLGSYAAAAVISLLYESSLAALIASKGFQARANCANGHTGQLSSVSVLLSWAGSLGLAFVTLQEKRSFFSTATHILSACLSCVLMTQIYCYGSRKNILRNRNC